MRIKTFYGAEWCGDCKRSRLFLDKNKISYAYIDIDSDPRASQRVAEINNGLKSIPTIIFEDGSVLVEPSNHELKLKLELN